ncbi:hypothetical protein CLOHAE12215_02018 [Clostridium haemolyticum]|nr:hypothetical protein CLOHAE12215_02018 [Clostridium haemolyticum]
MSKIIVKIELSDEERKLLLDKLGPTIFRDFKMGK